MVVGINYRLGVLGFFSSHELRQEARARGETPYSNLGFADQRLALQWVSLLGKSNAIPAWNLIAHMITS